MIDPEGKQLGIMPTRQALTEAQRRELDLVEVAPNAAPPVCRIMDYGKYRYEQTKREKEARHHGHQVKTKEIKMRPNIGDGDFCTKRNHIIAFLEEGDRVKIICFFRGRENAHQEIGVQLLEKLLKEIAAHGAPEGMPRKMGNTYSVTVGPVHAKKAAPTPVLAEA